MRCIENVHVLDNPSTCNLKNIGIDFNMFFIAMYIKIGAINSMIASFDNCIFKFIDIKGSLKKLIFNNSYSFENCERFSTISYNNINFVHSWQRFSSRFNYIFKVVIWNINHNLYVQISSFNCLEGISAFCSSISRLLGDFPEFASSPNQGSCENCYGKSCSNINKAAMYFNPRNDRNEPIYKVINDREYRIKFIQGISLILWIIFILWYVWINRLT